MLIFNYNNTLNKFKQLHDETGGALKDFEFKYYDCFCGGKDYSIVATATRHRNHFDIVQCEQCGTLRMNPYLSDASIEKYYKEVYGPVKRGDVEPDALFTRQSKTSGKLLAMLAPHMPKGGKVLDYGSGAGGRMEAFKQAGYDVYLQDFDKNYLNYGLAKGMKEFTKDVKYDMVIFSHVIEHINHPVEFLKNLSDLLAPNGKIYLEVPLIENTKNGLLGDFHLAHKFYFTSESLSYLGHMAGFGNEAEFFNAVLVSKEKHGQAPSLSASVKKSNQCLIKARSKARIIQFKNGAKRLLTKA